MAKALGWGIVFAFLSFGRTASAADPPGSDGRSCGNAPASTSAEEERAFEVAMLRNERLAAFTKELVERAFDEATERFLRYSELTHRLAEQASAREQADFDSSVDLYLRKRELTQRLTAQTSADGSPPPIAAPTW